MRAAWEEYAYKIKYILFTAHNRTKACMARKVSVRKESHSQTERHQAPHRKNKGQRDIRGRRRPSAAAESSSSGRLKSSLHTNSNRLSSRLAVACNPLSTLFVVLFRLLPPGWRPRSTLSFTTTSLFPPSQHPCGRFGRMPRWLNTQILLA